MLIDNLLVAITFHFEESRLNYLKKVCSQIPFLAFDYKLLVFTNANEYLCGYIRDCLNDLNHIEIFSCLDIAHPFFLTWSHKPIFKNYLLTGDEFTHFMYLEDDIYITPENITYWLRGRNELYNLGFYPSFVRFELKSDGCMRYSTDITNKLKFSKLPHLFISPHYAYLNSPQPYQGMYLMDREMMIEYNESLAISPDFGPWNIREKAAQGLTFVNVPKDFFSRNLIGYNISMKCVDSGALIQHLPGNYANDPISPFGKIPIDEFIVL